jgi:N-carbamoyl-L-amino-acid hydrolase
MPVDRQRLLADLRTLAGFGKFETGVDRTAFSTQDMQARAWLASRMAEAGLDASIDDVGNVYGRMRGVSRGILIGSHTDTVPKGGWLDGSLGVIYGIEIARCIQARGAVKGAGVDVVSFQDEEGTFFALYGSRSFCGEDVAAEAAKAHDRTGRSLSDAVRAAGITGSPPARLDRARHLAYLEAHIEQGPRLEAAGDRIGVVTAIVGIRSFRIVFAGRADHAGTTPMALRSDAGAAAISFAAGIAERFRAMAGPDTVWNVGGCTFRPGANNVVPAEAELAFQLRDTSLAAMERLEATLHETATEAATRHKASVEVTRVLATLPTPMDRGLQDTVARAASTLAVPHQSLPSGAGHDALVLARYVPSAMLFVPSIGGRSHHVSENTSDEDIVTGADVMLEAVERHLESLA